MSQLRLFFNASLYFCRLLWLKQIHPGHAGFIAEQARQILEGEAFCHSYGAAASAVMVRVVGAVQDTDHVQELSSDWARIKTTTKSIQSEARLVSMMNTAKHPERSAPRRVEGCGHGGASLAKLVIERPFDCAHQNAALRSGCFRGEKRNNRKAPHAIITLA